MPDLSSLVHPARAPEAAAPCLRAWVRHSPRQETPCHLMGLAENDCWPAKVQDLSTGGVGLHLHEPIHVGRFVLVELVSASGLFSRLLLTRVVHVSPQADGSYLLGGEFISELPENELRFLLA